MLARHQSEPRHELARVFKACDVADLGHNRRSDCGVYTAQSPKSINHGCKMPPWNGVVYGSIEGRNPFLVLSNRALEFLEDKLLMGEFELSHLGQPSTVALCPVCAVLIAQTMSQ